MVLNKMVSITLSVPEKTRNEMKQFSEINWPRFVRTCIESKTKQLIWKREMLEKLKQEDDSGFTDWTIEMGHKVNKGITDRLKKEGLL